MGIKNAAAKHFKKLRTLQGPIEVPEWIDDETKESAKIFYKLLNENDRIGIKESMMQRDNSVNAILARRALDESGARIWKDIEVPEMDRDLDPEVVERILSDMKGGADLLRTDLAGCASDEATDEDIKN